MTDPNPDSAEISLQRAEALLELQRPAEAASLASAALAGDPENARAWGLLARCHEATGDFPAMLEAAAHAIVVEPEQSWTHRTASRAYSALKLRDEAVEAAERATALAPHSSAAHAQLAITLAQRAPATPRRRSLTNSPDLVAAKRHAAEAIALGPHALNGHAAAAYVAHRSAEPQDAETHYRAVLALDPNNAPAQHGLVVLAGAQMRSGFRGALEQLAAAHPHREEARRDLLASYYLIQVVAHLAGWCLYLIALGTLATLRVRHGDAASTTARIAVLLLLGVPALIAAVHLRRSGRTGRAVAGEIRRRHPFLTVLPIADLALVVCLLAGTFANRGALVRLPVYGLVLIVVSLVGLAWPPLRGLRSRPR